MRIPSAICVATTVAPWRNDGCNVGRATVVLVVRRVVGQRLCTLDLGWVPTVNLQQFVQSVRTRIGYELHAEQGFKWNRDWGFIEEVDTPRVFTFRMWVRPSIWKQLRRLTDELSIAAGLDEEQKVRISLSKRGSVAVEVPLPKECWGDPYTVHQMPRRRKGMKAVIGLDTVKRPLTIDFTDPLTPHWLIAGTTGAGKSNAARVINWCMTAQNTPHSARFIYIDVKKHGKTWRPFDNVPHLIHPIVTDFEEAERVLVWVQREIANRAERDQTTPMLFVAIDEAQVLLKESQVAVKAVDDIAATGREYGIRLQLLTQNPTVEQIGTANIKRNMNRIVGKVDGDVAERVAAGGNDYGAKSLSAAGDMIVGKRRGAIALMGDRDFDRLERTDHVARLELVDSQTDLDHIKARVSRGEHADPIEPEEIAYVLCNGAGTGINALATGYRDTGASIGNAKMSDVREYTRRILEAMQSLECDRSAILASDRHERDAA